MIKLKKLTTAAAAAALTASMCMTAFAGQLTAKEQEIITQLNNSGFASSSAQSVAVQNFLMNNDVSDAQAAIIIGKISAANAIVSSAGGAKSLTADQVASIVKLAGEAGDAVGVSVSYDTSSGVVTAMQSDGTAVTSFGLKGVVSDAALPTTQIKNNTTVTGSNNDNKSNNTSEDNKNVQSVTAQAATSTSNNGVIKATGASSMAPLYAVMGVLTVSLAGCGVAVMKKKKVTE